MHPAPVRYAPGHPSTTPPSPHSTPLPRSTSRSRENDLRQTLAERVSRWTKDVDHLSTAIPNLSLHRREVTTQPMDCMVEPSFGLVVQGTKRLIQSGDGYLCDANRFLITSLDLPGSTQVIEASRERPFLGIGPSLIFASWRN